VEVVWDSFLPYDLLTLGGENGVSGLFIKKQVWVLGGG